MAFSDLTKEEIDLLAKLGITEHTVTKQRKEKDPTKAPVAIDLTLCSGQFELHCKCCGAEDRYFCDYVKRADDAGYAIVKVEKPKYTPTKHHRNDVICCSYCKDEELHTFHNEHLKEMIMNLRHYLRTGGVK